MPDINNLKHTLKQLWEPRFNPKNPQNLNEEQWSIIAFINIIKLLKKAEKKLKDLKQNLPIG